MLLMREMEGRKLEMNDNHTLAAYPSRQSPNRVSFPALLRRLTHYGLPLS